MSYYDGEEKERVTLTDVEAAMSKQVSLADGDIKQVALYHLRSGGSRVRAGLALQSASALKLDAKTSLAIASACEMLHNASLVHDDLQDADDYRRGDIAVWKKFGTNAAICLGDMMVSAAYAALCSAQSEKLPALIMHMHQRVSDVIEGQHADLETNCLTIRDYDDIARMKSSPLLGLPVELSLLCAGYMQHIKTAMQASDAIAIAYQVTDDISDAQCDIAAGDLNYLALIEGDMVSRANAARSHAAGYARSAIAVAKSLPEHSGDGLIRLAEKFIPAIPVGEAA